MKKIRLLALAGVAWAGTALGHGLTMTTAGVSIRNDTHLIVHLQYDPLRVWSQANSSEGGRPPSPAELANMADAQFERGYDVMKTELEGKFSARFDGQPVESLHFHFPPAAEFKRLVRQQFMDQVMDKEGGHTSHDHREYYLNTMIDGFLPKGAEKGGLDITFPPSLGEILATYSRPQSQTLAPEKDGVHYHQEVAPCRP